MIDLVKLFRLRVYLEPLGLSAPKLAEAAGIGRSSMFKKLQGLRTLLPQDVEALEAATGLGPSDLDSPPPADRGPIIISALRSCSFEVSPSVMREAVGASTYDALLAAGFLVVEGERVRPGGTP